jgi:hypothetical protein
VAAAEAVAVAAAAEIKNVCQTNHCSAALVLKCDMRSATHEYVGKEREREMYTRRETHIGRVKHARRNKRRKKNWRQRHAQTDEHRQRQKELEY